MTQPKAKKPPSVGVGSPAHLHLELFGELLLDAFGEMPYLVGSAARGKVWRDVDVRVILADAKFDRWFGKQRPRMGHSRWGAYTMAFSALGQQMTGLPIDFQIQPQREANLFDGVRHAIGIAHPIPARARR